MVPVGVTDANRDKVTKATNEYKEIFSKAGIRIKIDDRDKYTAGWKFNHWELKVFLFLKIKLLEFHLNFTKRSFLNFP